MNLYFLFEGKRTEPRVYRAWLAQVFRDLTEVKRVSEIQQDNYFIMPGTGYPAYLDRIEESVRDVERQGNIDRFFICVDGEEDPQKTDAVIQRRISGKLSQTKYKVIIANCCIETWFLGNEALMPETPSVQLLNEFRQFYDVSANCPESLPVWKKYARTRAQFHKTYLKELLRENGYSYSESNPGIVREKKYIEALVDRHDKTGHLQSFGQLISEWRSLGGGI